MNRQYRQRRAEAQRADPKIGNLRSHAQWLHSLTPEEYAAVDPELR